MSDLSYAEFIGLFPEFGTADQTFVETVIAEVEFEVSDAFASRRMMALALATAARLADSPQGRNARLDPGKRNVYAERLAGMRRVQACAANRIG